MVALAAALALLAVGILVRWHETEVAHAHEQSGQVIHAQELADHHEEDATDHLHGRDAHGHVGDCALLAMLHESIAHASRAALSTTVASISRAIAMPSSRAIASIAAYRLAPKTSPPAA